MKTFYFTIVLISLSFTSFAQCFTKISTGYNSNHALKSNGTLWNWGDGSFGQFGNNSLFDNYEPTQTTLTGAYLFFNAGRLNTFVIKNTGTLWGSGDNLYGNLGVNSTSEYSGTFLQIGTATNWKQVSAGTGYTFATKTDNTLWGWGQNNNYQMGNNSCCADRLSPGQIGTDTDWKLAIACSSTPVGLGLKTNGTLWGWGGNGSALLGPSNVSSRAVPTQLSSDTDWETLATGAAHALALKTNGTLWAWGVGFNGQAGDELTPLYFRDTPRQIGTDTWSYIACGFQNSFAIKSDGTLWAWGRNDTGQLGDGTTIERRLPVQIGTDTDWVSVAAGFQHGVALKANGALYTWGLNDYGQLGNGGTTPQPLPTYIPVTGCSLDVADFEKPAFTLYPNPAKSEVTIRYTNLENSAALELYDLMGRSLYTQPLSESNGELVIPLPNYPSGIYIVVLRSEKGILEQRKLVIE